MKKPLQPDDVNDTCNVFFIADVDTSEQDRSWIRLENGPQVIPELAGKTAFTPADGHFLIRGADCVPFRLENQPAIWCANDKQSEYTLLVQTTASQYEVAATRWPYDPASARYAFTRIAEEFFFKKTPAPPYTKPLLPSKFMATYYPPQEPAHKWNDLKNGLWEIQAVRADVYPIVMSRFNVCIADGGASLQELVTEDLDKCRLAVDPQQTSTPTTEHIDYNCRDFLTGTMGKIVLSHADNDHYQGQIDSSDFMQTGGRMGPVRKTGSQQSTFKAMWVPDPDRTCQDPVTKAIFDRPRPEPTAADNAANQPSKPGSPPNKTCMIRYQTSVPNPAGSTNSYTYAYRTRVGHGYECP